MDKRVRDEWIVIGLSGVTCGGKTTLANKLCESLCPVYVFNQDKYFHPDDSPLHVKCEGLDHNNYDILSALDMEGMYRDILHTMEGMEKSHYRNTQRRNGLIEVKGKKFLVVEGFTVLNYGPILELCDLKYYLVLEKSECLSRRARRVYDPPDVPGYFERCVWPEHCRYRHQVEQDGSVQLVDSSRQDVLQLILHRLHTLGAAYVQS